VNEPPAKRACVTPLAPLEASKPDGPAAAPLADEVPPDSAVRSEGVLACGPFTLQKVVVMADKAERSYPSGVGALANVHWGIAAKANPSLVDGPVWSVISHELNCLDGREMRLKMQKSKYRFVEYTNFSDEGKLLPATSRCSPCGAMVLAETAEGLVVLAQRSSTLEQQPGSWQIWPAGRLEFPDRGGDQNGPGSAGLDLPSVLQNLVVEQMGETVWESVSRAHIRVLALLLGGEEAFEGRKHELLFRIRLNKSALEIEQAVAERRTALLQSKSSAVPTDKLAFVQPPGSARAPTTSEALQVFDLDSLLSNSRQPLTKSSHRALMLLRELNVAKSV